MKKRLNLLDLCRMYYEEGAKDEEKRKEAFGFICQSMYNTIRSEANITYDFYGKDEIKWSGIEYDDLIDAGVLGVDEGLRHFNFNSDDFSSAVFRSYMHLYVKGEIRRCIQVANGVSQYYCQLLIRMKMRGLDFDMTDEELSAGLGEKLITIENLRYTFRENRKLPYDNTIAELEDASQNVESRHERAEFAEELVNLIKTTVPKDDLPLFYDLFMREKPLKYVDCAEKYEMSVYFIKRKSDIFRKNVMRAIEKAKPKEDNIVKALKHETNDLPLPEIEELALD